MPLSILIVEDNRLIAFSLMNELQSANHRVVTAHSSSEAKKLSSMVKPDIIIMDVNLGEKRDGIELMEEIQSEIGKIPNIYLSGYVKEELVVRTQSTEPLSILEKPIDSRHLINLLDEFDVNKQ